MQKTKAAEKDIEGDTDGKEEEEVMVRNEFQLPKISFQKKKMLGRKKLHYWSDRSEIFPLL